MNMRIELNTSSADSYAMFLRIKSLPAYRFSGRSAFVPDQYAAALGVTPVADSVNTYVPNHNLYDFQRDITRMAIERGRYAVFADCGLGKTLIELDFARHVSKLLGKSKCVLLVTPLMVVPQLLEEADRFYGSTLPIEQIRAAQLPAWLASGTSRIGVTNYDALTDAVQQGRLGALILDESSMLKSHYGAWAGHCLRLGRGLKYKLACTGTPAPNDRIEYANHAVFLDAFPTVNSFLARYFVNRGQTDNRWELKPHALEPFYRAISHWSIFLANPASYGWDLDTSTIPPINVHLHDIPLTVEQRDLCYDHTGRLFSDAAGGITSRSVLSQIAKGNHRGKRVDTNKPAFIRSLVESWPQESTIIWCRFNAEQERIEWELPNAASISGDTPEDDRLQIIHDFKAGKIKTLISKPKILGFGLNLHVATRQIFSGLQDSYEEYYQAVKRSNRIGSKHLLNVHIPMTDIERPMIGTVMRKAKMVQEDTRYQEQLFRSCASAYITT